MSDKTPSGVKIIAVADDSSTTNITEGVQALYDIVIQSMDWGSGFLSVEEALPIARLAMLCGFENLDEAQKYLKAVELQKAGVNWWSAQRKAGIT